MPIAIPVVNKLMVLFMAGMLALTPITTLSVQHTPEIRSETTVYEQGDELLIIDQIEGGSQIVMLADKPSGKITQTVVVKRINKSQVINPKNGNIEVLTNEEQTVIEKWSNESTTVQEKIAQDKAKQGIIMRTLKGTVRITGQILSSVGNFLKDTVSPTVR